jgi:hypothetical protein
VVKPSIVAPPEASPTVANRPAPKPTAAPVAAAPAPPPPPPGTLGSILFQGGTPFTKDELTTLTGLTLGTKPTQEALQSATDHLVQTGLFANVSANYDTPNDVGTATFTLTPMPPSQLAHPSFANIIWLTPTEIDDALKTVPLYHGYFPLSDGLHLADQVQAALERELAARHVQAVLTHSLIAPTQAHPYTAVEFRVTAPKIVLAQAQVFDIPPALVNKTLAAEAAAVKYPYNEGDADITLSDLLLAPARDAGYIGAHLWRIDRKRRASGNTIYVDFSARLNSGPIYSVRALNWTPNAVLSDADFKKLSALHLGQVPNATAQQQTEQAVLAAYYSHGYLEASVSSTQTLDSRTGAASYTFTASAGPQYTVRSISIEGLDTLARKEFDAAWLMKPGDLYNEPYLLNFLATHPDLLALKPYTFTYNRAASTDTHQVDLTLTFKHN